MTTTKRMKSMIDLLHVAENIGMAEVSLTVEDFRLALEQAQANEVRVMKQRKGIPTVIEYNGDRYTYDSPTTFRGGVQRGKQNKSTN